MFDSIVISTSLPRLLSLSLCGAASHSLSVYTLPLLFTLSLSLPLLARAA